MTILSPTVCSFQRHIGVDVGKEELVFYQEESKELHSIPNTAQGIEDFLTAHPHWLVDAFFVVDSTGGWERPLIASLLTKNLQVHRADGRKVKSFTRSLGCLAKTDAIDAKMLARYAKERQPDLRRCVLAEDSVHLLQSLLTRRQQLATHLKEEKQRHSAPLSSKVIFLIEQHIDLLTDHLEAIEAEIHACIEADACLRERADILLEIPGIGQYIAAFLLAEMPEIGQTDRKKIASHAYDSGKMHGRRTTFGGRIHVKHMLFLVALNAVRSKENPFRTFYERLINAGKSKRCALIVTARKIVTVANARLKEKYFLQPQNMSR